MLRNHLLSLLLSSPLKCCRRDNAPLRFPSKAIVCVGSFFPQNANIIIWFSLKVLRTWCHSYCFNIQNSFDNSVRRICISTPDLGYENSSVMWCNWICQTREEVYYSWKRDRLRRICGRNSTSFYDDLLFSGKAQFVKEVIEERNSDCRFHRLQSCVALQCIPAYFTDERK